MALILKDRVQETSTTTGTGTLTLAGAVTQFQTFSSAVGNGNTTYYTIYNAGGSDWEVGIGTVGAGTLARTTILASSNAGAAVNFTGTLYVFGDYPAGKAAYLDASGVINNTTFNATTSVITPIVQATNSGGLALKNSAGTTQISMGAGGGDNASINVSTNLNGTNAQIDISPTGTGHVHINPTGSGSIEINPTSLGTINNMSLGATTAAAAKVTTLNIQSGLTLATLPGTSGQVLTSAGTGAVPTWTTPTTGTVTSVAATVPSFLSVTGSPITSSGTLAISLSGTALPIANGGTGKTSAPAAMANLMGFTSTATAAGTTVLDNTSSYYQLFTGSTTQTITLPVTSTLQTGWTFHICNNSTGALTVNSSGGNLLITVIAGTTVMCTCIGTTLTTAADWEAGYTDFSTATGTGAVVLATAPSLSNSTLTGNISATGSSSATILLGTAVTTGTIDVGGTAQTGTISIGRSSSSHTLNISNGSISTGNTNAINIGTQGSTGSTTNITIGGVNGTSTTTINGTLVFTGSLSPSSISTSGAITSGGLLTASAGLSVTGAGTINNLTTQDGASGFTIKNVADATKVVQFDASTLTTGTTYSYQFPTLSGSALATVGNLSQTFLGGTTFAPTTASSQIIIGSTTGTGTIQIGRSTAAQTIAIGTGVNTASVKTINIGTGGTGSTTAITIGSSAGSTTTTTVNGNLVVTSYTESVVAIGTVTTSNTIALTNGTVQTATLTASTACTFTMPTATAGKSFILLLKQAATTGNGTATFTGVKWGTAGAPTITATAGAMDILTFVADGTNWYGSIAQGYTP